MASPPALDSDRLRHTYTAWSPHPDLGRALRSEFRRAPNVRVLLHANATAIQTNPERTAFDGLAVSHLGGTHAQIRARACVLCGGGIENARLLLMSGDPEAGGLANAHGNVAVSFPLPRGHWSLRATTRRLAEGFARSLSNQVVLVGLGAPPKHKRHH